MKFAPKTPLARWSLTVVMTVGAVMGIYAATQRAYTAYQPKSLAETQMFVLAVAGIYFFLVYDFWDKLIKWGFLPEGPVTKDIQPEIQPPPQSKMPQRRRQQNHRNRRKRR